jgi:hypothetical protein
MKTRQKEWHPDTKPLKKDFLSLEVGIKIHDVRKISNATLQKVTDNHIVADYHTAAMPVNCLSPCNAVLETLK